MWLTSPLTNVAAILSFFFPTYTTLISKERKRQAIKTSLNTQAEKASPPAEEKKSSWPQTSPRQHSMWEGSGANLNLVLRQNKVWPKNIKTSFSRAHLKRMATHSLKYKRLQGVWYPQVFVLWTFPSPSCAKPACGHLTTPLLLLQFSGAKAVLLPQATYLSPLGPICLLMISMPLLLLLLSDVSALWKPCHQTRPPRRKSQHIPKETPTQAEFASQTAREREMNNKGLVKDHCLPGNAKHLFWIREDRKWSILN